jgi:hypothetical protein
MVGSREETLVIKFFMQDGVVAMCMCIYINIYTHKLRMCVYMRLCMYSIMNILFVQIALILLLFVNCLSVVRFNKLFLS